MLLVEACSPQSRNVQRATILGKRVALTKLGIRVMVGEKPPMGGQGSLGSGCGKPVLR
jgi:hypothetical protein